MPPRHGRAPKPGKRGTRLRSVCHTSASSTMANAFSKIIRLSSTLSACTGQTEIRKKRDSIFQKRSCRCVAKSSPFPSPQMPPARLSFHAPTPQHRPSGLHRNSHHPGVPAKWTSTLVRFCRLKMTRPCITTNGNVMRCMREGMPKAVPRIVRACHTPTPARRQGLEQEWATSRGERFPSA